MKRLVDILVENLPSWPDHIESLWISSYGSRYPENTIFGSTGNHSFEFSGYWDVPCDYKTARVTRAEWQAAVDALDQSELDAVLAKNEQLAAARAERIPVWNGEGLPPVGLDVEIKRGNCTWIDGDEWQIGKTATVMASFLNSRDIEMASVQFPGGHCECILARCLSPIRTAEQVAAEEREKAAKELYMTINWDSKPGTWENLLQARRDDYRKAIDAGYRKEPKPCGS